MKFQMIPFAAISFPMNKADRKRQTIRRNQFSLCGSTLCGDIVQHFHNTVNEIHKFFHGRQKYHNSWSTKPKFLLCIAEKPQLETANGREHKEK
jgi:hypothetical protein